MSKAENIARVLPHDDLVKLLAELNHELLIELGTSRPQSKARGAKRDARSPSSPGRALPDVAD